MKKITPFLWFNDNAEEAMQFYLSIFPNSHANGLSRYPEGTPGPLGSVMTVSFNLNGQEFVGLNGGPEYKFTPAISFVINCDSQEEIDYFWDKLSEGGMQIECGWLQDKFGVSWQVVPNQLIDLLAGADQARTQRIMAAVMQMKKLDLATLEKAAEGP